MSPELPSARWAAAGLLAYDNIPITHLESACQPVFVAAASLHAAAGYYEPPGGRPSMRSAWRSRGWNPGGAAAGTLVGTAGGTVDPWLEPCVGSGGVQPTFCSGEVFCWRAEARVEPGWNPGHRIGVSSQVSVRCGIFHAGRAIAGTRWTPSGFHPGFQLTGGNTNEKRRQKAALEPGTLVFHSVAGGLSDWAP